VLAPVVARRGPGCKPRAAVREKLVPQPCFPGSEPHREHGRPSVRTSWLPPAFAL